MSETTLTDLQVELQGRLLADEVLKTVPALIEDKADISSDVAQALGPLNAGSTGLVGACILVRQPVANDDMPDVTFAPLDSEWTFTVIENPVVNRASGGTGLRALTICRRLHRVMKNYTPSGLAANFVPLKPCIQPNDDFAPLPAYDVRFGTRESEDVTYQKVARPVLSIQSQGGGFAQVLMACATPGASIYYTLVAAGGYPWSGNGSATLYNGVAINVQQPKTIRAAASLAGYVDSDVAQLIV